MAKTLEYKCPSCGAAVRFDPHSGMIVCDACGYKMTPQDYEKAKKDGSINKEGKNTEDQKFKNQKSFDWSQYVNTSQLSKLDPTVVYTCSSCGAQLETDGVTMATHCPYCDNNVLVEDRAEGSLRPNYVIPFKITPDQVPAVVKKFYHKKRFLPKAYLTESRLDEIQGVYVPFWLFSANLYADVMLNGEKTRSYRDGDYDVTETEYYDLFRSGNISFKNIPVDASVKMDNNLMDSLEPYDYSQMVEFNPSYMSGYLADRFDSGPEVEIARADRRMRATALSNFEKTCRGYSSVSGGNLSGSLTSADVRYVMFPVYLAHVKFKGKKYQFAINGQTGKIAGSLPVDKGRQRLWFWRTTGIVAAAAFAAMTLLQII